MFGISNAGAAKYAIESMYIYQKNKAFSNASLNWRHIS